MQTVVDGLVELYDRGISFLRQPATRVLHAIAPGEMMTPVVRVISSLGLRPESRGPVLLLSQQAEASTDGSGLWRVLVSQVREQFEEWMEARNGHEHGWLTLPEAPTCGGLTGFAAQLGQLAMARPQEEAEIIVVLAVGRTLKGSNSLSVAPLIISPNLSPIRWILVDDDATSIDANVTADDGIVVVHLSSHGEYGELSSMSHSFTRPVGRIRGARSPAMPPRKSSATMQLEASPEVDAGADIAHQVVLAAEARKKGDGIQGVELQCRVRDLCATQGDPQSSVTMEMLLGGYLLAEGAHAQAVSSFQRAFRLSEAADGDAPSAMAAFAVGMSMLQCGDACAALLAFADATALAEETDAPALAFSVGWLAGEMAARLGLEQHAASFWSRSIAAGKASNLVPKAVLREKELALSRLPASKQSLLDAELKGNPGRSGCDPSYANGTVQIALETMCDRHVGELSATNTTLIAGAELALMHGWSLRGEPDSSS